MDNKIDVSVYVLTYYHEKYIKQALDSILMQKTKYKYEIIISDDCSNDGTKDIIIDYQKKYPDIIRIDINSENIGIPKNIYKARCMCRGRYIVGLSGDDYWIDPFKIEKECTFLDKHNEYIAVFNGIELRYDDDDFPYEVVPTKKERNTEFSIIDYQKGKTLRSHGFMMRNFFLDEDGRSYFKQAQIISDKIDDAVDVVLIMKKGRVFIIDEITDAHRVIRIDKDQKHNYNSKYCRLEKYTQYIELVNRMDAYFNKDLITVDFRKKYEGATIVAELDMIASFQYKEYKRVFRTIPKRYRKPFISSIFVTSIPRCVLFLVNRALDTMKAFFLRLYR